MTAQAAAPAVPPATDRPVALLVYRDDGPVERALGRVLGPLPAVPPLVLVLAGALPLALAIVLSGAGASNGLAAAAIAWLILLGGASSGRPHEDRLRWMVPPLLRAAEYGAILWLAAIAGAEDTGAAFALLAAIAFRHYDLVYRLRHQSTTPPEWLNRLCGGWAGRLAVAWLLTALDALPAGFFALAALLGAVLVTESVASWTRFSRALRPVIVYEEEEDEGQ